jgi:branched-chain amino acid aminotransferase
VITPPLDGTILPGVTRDSALALLRAHSPENPAIPFSCDVTQASRIHVHERTFTLSELIKWAIEGRLLEAFGVGTAVVVCPVGRIGYPTVDADGSEKTLLEDILLPEYDNGLGPVGHAIWKQIVDIQEGRVEWGDWSVVCQSPLENNSQ